MRVTFKLYANLGDYLPASARQNAVDVEVENGTSLNALLDRFGVPQEKAHLVLVNGTFHAREQRDDGAALKDGDTVAVGPPVAGG